MGAVIGLFSNRLLVYLRRLVCAVPSEATWRRAEGSFPALPSGFWRPHEKCQELRLLGSVESYGRVDFPAYLIDRVSVRMVLPLDAAGGRSADRNYSAPLISSSESLCKICSSRYTQNTISKSIL